MQKLSAGKIHDIGQGGPAGNVPCCVPQHENLFRPWMLATAHCRKKISVSFTVKFFQLDHGVTLPHPRSLFRGVDLFSASSHNFVRNKQITIEAEEKLSLFVELREFSKPGVCLFL